jgi:integrase
MQRSELRNLDDPVAAFWEIPGERTKNGLTHVVPLSELARQTVLEALRSVREGQPYVFPSPVRVGESVQAHSLTVAMQRMAEHIEGDAAKTWKADPPSPHDLRRTFRTKLSALGVPKDIRDRLMNHAPRDVGERHYDQYDFVKEKREALTRWADALSELVSVKEMAEA